MASDDLLAFEQRIGALRKAAHDRWKSGEDQTAYARGLAWAKLATLDAVLADLRVAIDGPAHEGRRYGGAQHQRLKGVTHA